MVNRKRAARKRRKASARKRRLVLQLEHAENVRRAMRLGGDLDPNGSFELFLRQSGYIVGPLR